MASLEDVTILIPTFHRRGYLERAVSDINSNLPDCKIVIVSDDGILTPDWAYDFWITLPYDAGLTSKRNAGVKASRTKYTLLGSDDFDFSTLEFRRGLVRMTEVLDAHPEIDAVSGRVIRNDYEGFIEYVPGQYIKEHRLNKLSKPNYWQPHPVWKIDISHNFFLARTDVLLEVPWDESIRPIGGEHVDWFLDMKDANKVIVFLPTAEISEMDYDASMQHPDYLTFRSRCWDGHNLMMKKRDIKRYVSFDEEM